MKNDNIDNVLNFLGKRRSVRKFKTDIISAEIIQKLIECATLAPSACNKQDWRFIVIDNPDIKRKIVDGGSTNLIKSAPCGILITYSNLTINNIYHDDLQSAAAAIENLLLAAANLNLGACWICNLPTKRYLRKLLNIPSHYSPVAYVLLGYPADIKPIGISQKNKLENIIAYNKFPDIIIDENIPKFIWVKQFITWIYRNSPVIIKKKLLNKLIDKKFTKKFDN